MFWSGNSRLSVYIKQKNAKFLYCSLEPLKGVRKLYSKAENVLLTFFF